MVGRRHFFYVFVMAWGVHGGGEGANQGGIEGLSAVLVVLDQPRTALQNHALHYVAVIDVVKHS